MIVVTGAAGFIGSCMLSKLNSEGFKDVVLVDDFSSEEKNRNFKGKTYSEKVNRDNFFTWIDENHKFIQFVFHMGARSATTGFPKEVYDKLNLDYSKTLWNKCVQYGLPLVYASSAATYGLGELGYNDEHALVEKLHPLNLYGESKNDFDKWALNQEKQPYFWAGLKFFNVYGPNEYHKGRMASVILHAFNQIKTTGKMKLFKSHHLKFPDGGQTRDFVYVKDLVEVMYFLMHHRKDSGLYNVGTGLGRTFLDLTLNTFKAMGINQNIEFIDTPVDIRDKYQYFTEANMQKLRSIGYKKAFYTLEAGVHDYVTNYLLPNTYY
ncbi:MAG: ADP-glyceromanno-heptose 6-epimerase [Bacteroidetes bacterium HGW-Bacteroidetes-4]|jgi:ADP-L-glycero-D-manno-heptose 6-epimerase|nr:MAG: ADP-glyceromanno-heptose 6-epimerase [Bacteroidetes bacterium HGW-Bacteroidetes-4]